jgi:ADP-ribosylglycohydrolase
MTLPEDYAERVYAGVLGKTIGVYLGRPFEGWTYDRIQSRLGDIEYYVHDKVGVPLLVTDDDIAGTFTFLRTLMDNGFDPELSAEAMGDGWLNYLIEGKTVLWWGGLGNSTEHTAYLRLKNGVKAPASGSAALNSQVVSEQIGAQIFIDGWAMVSPGNPDQAARLAERAAMVSHDGEAVHGAVVLAVMEAMAFVERDANRLLDKALEYIPADSVIAGMIGDIRRWHQQEPDWRVAREMLSDQYGYDTYGGNCHIVPNHGLIVLALLYGNDDFSDTLKIINTCGWDTDCNSGNLACLMGIKEGLAGIDAGVSQGRDWRGPIADRIYVPTADPSWGISDCVLETQHIVNAALALRGETAWRPKSGAQFHFEMPGSLQGFTVTDGDGVITNQLGVSQAGQHALRLQGHGSARFGTPTFAPSADFAAWTEQSWNPYPLIASPRVYPGQRLSATLLQGGGANVRLYVAFYDANDDVQRVYSAPQAVDDRADLSFLIPEEAFPAFEVGVETAGTVYLDCLSWSGEPRYIGTRPSGRRRGGSMWRRSWVNGVDDFMAMPWVEPFRLIQNAGRGLLIQGNRDWRDIVVSADVCCHLGVCAGVAVRVQGMRRYYSLLLHRSGEVQITKVIGEETVLARAPFEWELGQTYQLQLCVRGNDLIASVDGREVLTASDEALTCGGMALVIEEGRTATQQIAVAPA